MDWFSRFVLRRALSLPLDVDFCLEALRGALQRGRQEILSSDQGSQFTSEGFTGELKARGNTVSMDGRERCMDNIFIGRLWRSMKYEEVYLRDYRAVSENRGGIQRYPQFYSHQHFHQSLSYRTPAAVHAGEALTADG
jgi:putative transposase